MSSNIDKLFKPQQDATKVSLPIAGKQQTGWREFIQQLIPEQIQPNLADRIKKSIGTTPETKLRERRKKIEASTPYRAASSSDDLKLSLQERQEAIDRELALPEGTAVMKQGHQSLYEKYVPPEIRDALTLKKPTVRTSESDIGKLFKGGMTVAKELTKIENLEGPAGIMKAVSPLYSKVSKLINDVGDDELMTGVKWLKHLNSNDVYLSDIGSENLDYIIGNKLDNNISKKEILDSLLDSPILNEDIAKLYANVDKSKKLAGMDEISTTKPYTSYPLTEKIGVITALMKKEGDVSISDSEWFDLLQAENKPIPNKVFNFLFPPGGSVVNKKIKASDILELMKDEAKINIPELVKWDDKVVEGADSKSTYTGSTPDGYNVFVNYHGGFIKNTSIYKPDGSLLAQNIEVKNWDEAKDWVNSYIHDYKVDHEKIDAIDNALGALPKLDDPLLKTETKWKDNETNTYSEYDSSKFYASIMQYDKDKKFHLAISVDKKGEDFINESFDSMAEAKSFAEGYKNSVEKGKAENKLLKWESKQSEYKGASWQSFHATTPDQDYIAFVTEQPEGPNKGMFHAQIYNKENKEIGIANFSTPDEAKVYVEDMIAHEKSPKVKYDVFNPTTGENVAVFNSEQEAEQFVIDQGPSKGLDYAKSGEGFSEKPISGSIDLGDISTMNWTKSDLGEYEVEVEGIVDKITNKQELKDYLDGLGFFNSDELTIATNKVWKNIINKDPLPSKFPAEKISKRPFLTPGEERNALTKLLEQTKKDSPKLFSDDMPVWQQLLKVNVDRTNRDRLKAAIKASLNNEGGEGILNVIHDWFSSSKSTKAIMAKLLNHPNQYKYGYSAYNESDEFVNGVKGLLQALDRETLSAPALFRGREIRNAEQLIEIEGLKVGQIWSILPSSFSTDSNVSRGFARGMKNVMLRLKGGGKALNIAELRSSTEYEWITGGEFLIDNIEDIEGWKYIDVTPIKQEFKPGNYAIIPGAISIPWFFDDSNDDNDTQKKKEKKKNPMDRLFK